MSRFSLSNATTRQIVEKLRSAYLRLVRPRIGDAEPRPVSSTPPEIERALTYLRQGDAPQAEALCLPLLSSNEHRPHALHVLGLATAQGGRYREAAEYLAQAIKAAPSNPALHLHYGNVLRALGRHELALASYNRTLVLEPSNPGAHNNRGIVLNELGRTAEALESYEKALTVDPGYVDALNNRGALLAAAGKYDDALSCYEQILRQNPNHPGAQLTRANVLVSMQRPLDALAAYDAALALGKGQRDIALPRCVLQQAMQRHDEVVAGYDIFLALNPSDAEAWFKRGVALVESGRYHEAVNSYDHVLETHPQMAEALNNRGIAQWHAGEYEDAVNSYDRAITARPSSDAHYNRGQALDKLNLKTEALDSYEQAVIHDPKNTGALHNRGVLLSEMKLYEHALNSFDALLAVSPNHTMALAARGGIFNTLGLYERAMDDFQDVIRLAPDTDYMLGNKLYAELSTCTWGAYNETRQRICDTVRAGKNTCFPYTYLITSNEPAEQLKCAQRYAGHRYPPSTEPLWRGERYRHDKIRIAYLSADFHEHATSYLMAELFERHDREKFEVTAWSFGLQANDRMRDRLRTAFDRFVEVNSLSDLDVATQLREQEIDIAVDLKGFSRDARPGIFAHRAVPIQVNYLVYPGTMGASYIDYIMADTIVIPPEHDAYYSEKVVRLPISYQVNDTKRAISKITPSREACGLPSGGFVFCCFNKNYKIVPDIFDIWMRLLRKVDGSVLWLFNENATAARNLQLEAKARGVAPERVIFAAHMPLADHLARHRLADLFLDTLPCNAHTTISDALWAGLPALTCLGNSFPGRVAASLLHGAELSELVTRDLEGYEALALKIATTPELLSSIRARLAEKLKTCALFDIERSCRNIESAYTDMYERYQSGENPQSFSVM